MTYVEFLKALTAAQRRIPFLVPEMPWGRPCPLRGRVGRQNVCPITAVYFDKFGTVYGVDRALEAAEAMGMDRTQAREIMRFADLGLPGDQIRQDLELAIKRGRQPWATHTKWGVRS